MRNPAFGCDIKYLNFKLLILDLFKLLRKNVFKDLFSTNLTKN